MRTSLPTLLLLVGCAAGGEVDATLDGTLEWAVDFDAAAEARGFEDCSYKRVYDGFTDRSMPWLCPDCDAVFRVESRLKGAACYGQITDQDPSPTEWLGWSGKTFRRASTEHFWLSEQGTIGGGDQREVAYTTDPREIADGGSFTLTLSGSLKTGEGRGDPMWGFTPPEHYACGWQAADPPVYEGDWTLSEGAPVPDGWFLDRCEEPVRLYDQLDRYLVIAISALDCPPCQLMAEEEEAFLADLAADGVEAGAVTLLAPTLSNVLEPMPTEDLVAWEESFGLTMPVLGDRGWGYWLGVGARGEQFAYPGVLIVAPDGTLLDLDVGFGGWDTVRQRILADAG